MDFEVVKDNGKKDDGSSKQAGSRKKRVGSNLKPKSPKKLQVMKEQESVVDDAKKEELRACLDIVPRDDIALNMDSGASIHMMVETKYPLTQEMLSRMLNRRLEIDHESTMAFELIRFIKAQLEE
ncbi:hypothetical protein Tco_1314292 [Tanacetum coccineum]